MIDKEQAQHMTDVAGECNRLNAISQPLGYAVTATTSVDDQSTQQFTVHRLDQTVARLASRDYADTLVMGLSQQISAWAFSEQQGQSFS